MGPGMAAGRGAGSSDGRADPRPDLLRRRNLIPLLVLGFLLVLVSGWRSFLYSRQLLIDSQEQSFAEVLRVLPRSLLPHLVVDDYVAIEQDLEGVMVDPSNRGLAGGGSPGARAGPIWNGTGPGAAAAALRVEPTGAP
jgi:hypothetical protein